MASIADRVYDNGLTVLTNEANKLTITSAEATTYTQANSTYALGNASITIGSPAARSGGGREVTVPAITGASVTGTGTAAYFALVDTVNSRLLATGSLASSQAVTSGNTFNLGSFKIGIPGAI